jgi:hypothetical protein
MRSVKMTFGLAAAVCALCVAAVPAMAHEFTFNIANKTISEETPARIKGGSEETQEFRLGQFTFTCEKTQVVGKVTGPESATLYNEVKFSKCITYLHPEKSTEKLPFQVRFKNAFDLLYHANGFAESGGESESEVNLVNPGDVVATVAGTKCLINYPPQTIPVRAVKYPLEEFSSAVFSPIEVASSKIKAFPSGFQHKLVITNTFTHLITETEEGKCSEFEHAESKTGYYKGSFTEEVVGGNVNFE